MYVWVNTFSGSSKGWMWYMWKDNRKYICVGWAVPSRWTDWKDNERYRACRCPCMSCEGGYDRSTFYVRLCLYFVGAGAVWIWVTSCWWGSTEFKIQISNFSNFKFKFKFKFRALKNWVQLSWPQIQESSLTREALSSQTVRHYLLCSSHDAARKSVSPVPDHRGGHSGIHSFHHALLVALWEDRFALYASAGDGC